MRYIFCSDDAEPIPAVKAGETEDLRSIFLGGNSGTDGRPSLGCRLF